MESEKEKRVRVFVRARFIILPEQGRLDDLRRMTEDAEHREKLFREFGLWKGLPGWTNHDIDNKGIFCCYGYKI